MNQYFEAFLLGNQAILTNVCLLPLYPGMIAFLVGNAQVSMTSTGGAAVAAERAPWYRLFLGVVVLGGVLSMMLLIGLILFSLRQPFGSLLPWLLPIMYLLVIVLGVALILGLPIFERLSVPQMPVLNHPLATAYVYGLLLAPMTLPCTGPLITSAFVIGATDVSLLSEGLFYFLCFGLGFGWPLVVLPLLAAPAQRAFSRFITRHNVWLKRASGLLLIGIGIFGFITEVLPMSGILG
jgi:cytochrome c-type biogenesis protein